MKLTYFSGIPAGDQRFNQTILIFVSVMIKSSLATLIHGLALNTVCRTSAGCLMMSL